MVNLSQMLCYRIPKYASQYFGRETPKNTEKYWKRRRLFLLTQHYRGRRRNCYTVAYRYHQRVFLKHNKLAAADQQDEEDLVRLRIEAGAEEVNFDRWHLREALARTHIALDDRVMSQLAIWEPRTFRSLIGIASYKTMQPRSEGGLGEAICGPQIETIDNGSL